MFNNRISYAREKEALSEVEIAKILGIAKSTYCNYEHERFIMPLNKLFKLVNIFNVSFDYLFGFINDFNYSHIIEELDYKKVGLRLKELRLNRNLSQKMFAIHTKNKRTNISGYELGNQLIPTSYLYEICKRYSISADYLLGRIDFIPDWCNKDFKN